MADRRVVQLRSTDDERYEILALRTDAANLDWQVVIWDKTANLVLGIPPAEISPFITDTNINTLTLALDWLALRRNQESLIVEVTFDEGGTTALAPFTIPLVEALVVPSNLAYQNGAPAWVALNTLGSAGRVTSIHPTTPQEPNRFGVTALTREIAQLRQTGHPAFRRIEVDGVIREGILFSKEDQPTYFVYLAKDGEVPFIGRIAVSGELGAETATGPEQRYLEAHTRQTLGNFYKRAAEDFVDCEGPTALGHFLRNHELLIETPLTRATRGIAAVVNRLASDFQPTLSNPITYTAANFSNDGSVVTLQAPVNTSGTNQNITIQLEFEDQAPTTFNQLKRWLIGSMSQLTLARVRLGSNTSAEDTWISPTNINRSRNEEGHQSIELTGSFGTMPIQLTPAGFSMELPPAIQTELTATMRQRFAAEAFPIQGIEPQWQADGRLSLIRVSLTATGAKTEAQILTGVIDGMLGLGDTLFSEDSATRSEQIDMLTQIKDWLQATPPTSVRVAENTIDLLTFDCRRHATWQCFLELLVKYRHAQVARAVQNTHWVPGLNTHSINQSTNLNGVHLNLTTTLSAREQQVVTVANSRITITVGDEQINYQNPTQNLWLADAKTGRALSLNEINELIIGKPSFQLVLFRADDEGIHQILINLRFQDNNLTLRALRQSHGRYYPQNLSWQEILDGQKPLTSLQMDTQPITATEGTSQQFAVEAYWLHFGDGSRRLIGVETRPNQGLLAFDALTGRAAVTSFPPTAANLGNLHLSFPAESSAAFPDIRVAQRASGLHFTIGIPEIDVDVESGAMTMTAGDWIGEAPIFAAPDSSDGQQLMIDPEIAAVYDLLNPDRAHPIAGADALIINQDGTLQPVSLAEIDVSETGLALSGSGTIKAAYLSRLEKLAQARRLSFSETSAHRALRRTVSLTTTAASPTTTALEPLLIDFWEDLLRENNINPNELSEANRQELARLRRAFFEAALARQQEILTPRQRAIHGFNRVTELQRQRNQRQIARARTIPPLRPISF